MQKLTYPHSVDVTMSYRVDFTVKDVEEVTSLRFELPIIIKQDIFVKICEVQKLMKRSRNSNDHSETYYKWNFNLSFTTNQKIWIIIY